MCGKLETVSRHFSFLRLSNIFTTCFKLLFISEMLAPSQMYTKQLDSLNLLSSVLTSSVCGLLTVVISFLIGRRNCHVLLWIELYFCRYRTYINHSYEQSLPILLKSSQWALCRVFIQFQYWDRLLFYPLW